MSRSLIPATDLLPASPEELKEVAGYVADSLAPATRRAYAIGLRDFRAWCSSVGQEALPASAETVARYLAAGAKAGRSVSTLQQRAAAIKWSHESQDLDNPTQSKGVRAVMAGIRRQLGTAPVRKAPAIVERLAPMVAHTDSETLKGLRDRAILLFGFASAMRRSELVALTLSDIEETSRGLLITVRRGKTDQEGKGHQRAIPLGRNTELCPVLALNEWLEAAEITTGAVFRSVDRHGNVGTSMSPKALCDVVKLYAEKAGLNPKDFGGHSLRAGFVTSAAEKGASAERIMDHTGHKSVAMVRVYTRRSDAFADHAGEGLL